MAIGAGLVTKFVVSLLEDGAIDELLSKKLEDLGEEFIRRQLSIPTGILKGLEGGGEDSFDKLRDSWLNKAKLPHIPHQDFLNKLFTTLEHATDLRKRRHSGRMAKWQRTAWARSRDDWLDNKWKHDWRSQPRNPVTGQWMPGRLDYADASMRYRGSKAGRRTKRRRNLRRQARVKGRKAARQLFARIKRKT